MNPQETKFILRAYRADGRYRTGDPLFADALAAADHDPAMAAWLAREQALDSVLANKLDGIQPPDGLREAILVGARASKPSRTRWRQPLWLAAAASIAILLGITLVRFQDRTAELSLAALTEFSLGDVAKDDHNHDNAPPAANALFVQLSAAQVPITVGWMPGFAEMKAAGCAHFSVAGADVFELCFERRGAWFHVYATRRPTDAVRLPSGTDPAITQHGHLAAATWAAGDTIYTVATSEGIEALRSIL